jgi:FAD/FMN-containing dehydrogenase
VVVNRAALATLLAFEDTCDVAELKRALPAWVALVVVAGYERRPEERVALYAKTLVDVSETQGAEALRTLSGLSGREAAVLQLLSGCWSHGPDWRLQATGCSRELFFLAPMSRMPSLVALVEELAARRSVPLADVLCHLQPLVQGRGCHCEFVFPRVQEAEDASAVRLEDFLREAARELQRAGAFFSRPYGDWAPMVFDAYADGVAPLRRLKEVLDPSGILNPGKLCF